MELVTTGSVLGTFGFEGCIKVVSCSGDYEHFFSLRKVYVSFPKHKLAFGRYRDGWFHIENVKLVFGGALLKLKGICVLEDAKHFVGASLLVERCDASVLKDGEFHAFDLCLCDICVVGSKVGRVVNVVDGGAGVLLEVVRNDSVSCYIPFNNEFIGDVDMMQRTIELKNEWIMG